MTNDDFERKMAFILEQQARVSANLEKLQERDAHWEERHGHWEERHIQWEARMDKVDRQIEQLVGFSGTLRDVLLGLTHHVERHEQAIAELVEQGKETDARLNALMMVVERHVSGHQ